MQQTSSLAKKTKGELLDEFQKMLAQYEELKMTAKLVHSPHSAEAIAKAKSYTMESVEKAIAELQTTTMGGLQRITATINEHLATLRDEILRAVGTFDQLQQAIEYSRKQLETQYHVQVAAETLERLVMENEMKQKQLEQEFATKKIALESEIELKRRDWRREQEEYEYTTKIRSTREQTRFEEEKQTQEKILQEREAAIINQETEFLSLKQQVQQLPERLQRELAGHGKKVGEEVEEMWKNKLELARKDWGSEKQLLELQLGAMKDQLKRAEAEIMRLKHESDLANQKAQELAVKVIESGVRTSSASETTGVTQTSSLRQ